MYTGPFTRRTSDRNFKKGRFARLNLACQQAHVRQTRTKLDRSMSQAIMLRHTSSRVPFSFSTSASVTGRGSHTTAAYSFCGSQTKNVRTPRTAETPA